MKILRITGAAALGLVALLVVLFTVLSFRYSATYVYRYIFWNISTITDYTLFPAHEIHNAPPVFIYRKDTGHAGLAEALRSCRFQSGGKIHTIGDLDAFLAGTDTTAFIVVRDDTVVYEKYFNGYGRDSINTSFSAAKSVTSALVGIAVDEGLIRSIDDPMVAYLPELAGKGMDGITIKNILMMDSGLKYVEGDFPWADDPVDYYHPKLRIFALEKAIVMEPPDLHFHYSNYHPQYLGMILERVTGMSPSTYLQERIWRHIGMEFGASWSTDSEESGFERMGSSINARAIDFAKLGSLFLDNGKCGGRQIISERWVTDSTAPEPPPTPDYYTGIRSWSNEFFAEDGAYYKYMWWGYENPDGTYDYFAWGKLGQVIYVSPAKRLVIVRNGSSNGGIYNWGAVCRAIAARL